MGKGLNELEFDEFEKLLDEIPDATSPTPNSVECGELVASSKNFKVENKGDLDNIGKLPVNEMKKSQVERAHQEEITSGDNQSLTSAFAGLSFNNGIRNQKATHTISDFSNGRHPNGFLNKMAPNVTSRAVSISSFRSSGSFDQTKGPSHQESSDLLSVGGVGDFQFLSNVHMSGIQFPSHEGKRYIMDSQSPVPSLSQPNIPWRHIEEGKLEGINHYTYMQQLKHHQLEGQVPIQTNSNAASRQFHQNCWQPCNNRSMSHHFELSGHDPRRNKPMISRTINQSNQNWFPEKILTRSHGLNSLRTVKHGSFNGTDFNNRRVSSNGHCHKDLFNCNSNSEFVLDCKKSRELFVDTADLSDGNWRPLLQKYNSVEEIYGKIYFLAKDQYGCRFLQSRFTEGNREDIDKIFSEIILHIVELMTDPFGNYLVQKLLEVCNDDQQMQIVRTITAKPGDLLRISCDMHGTRSVQKVIETLKSQEQFSIIVSSLKPGIVTLIKNMNGNHVAQKCLQYIMPEYRGFLFEAATANCVELATDRYGCCVLQKCLGQPDCEQMHHLICEIASNALVLSQDPFGNYVVQFVFEIDLPWATLNIIDQLEGNYGDLSMQKYSSNVVEKCLKYAGEERRCRIIRELIKNPHLDQIMQDPYGNYVFQAALKHSKGTLQAALVEAIRPLVPVLRTSPYGKKVLSSISVKI